ncbi:MAG: hypothetical protein JNK33_05880, partial [Candidatus Doudnabacteria bacterium]|nr:hypothetical protein [Candidatus Doudnabacteria bacterium]
MNDTRPITTVLLDVGGVMAPDPWETLWLTPERGLAYKLGLAINLVAATGPMLFEQFSEAVFTESAYWKAWEAHLRITISPVLIQEAERELLIPNPYLLTFLTQLKKYRMRIGITSNNTSFWYPKQVNEQILSDFIDPSLIFLSQELGASKVIGKPDLYELAARTTIPSQTLVIDDRQG